MQTLTKMMTLALMGAVFVPTAAEAKPRTHDGFFLKLGLGGGYTSYGNADDAVDSTLSGGAIEFDLSIGGTIADNLALYAFSAANAVPNPTLTVGSVEAESDDTVLTLRSFGVGLSYYLMPANVSLSIGAGITSAELEVRDPDSSVRITGTSDIGPYAFVGIGKEWWVGDEWGLGLGVKGSYARIPGDIDFDAFAVVGQFTVTYH